MKKRNIFSVRILAAILFFIALCLGYLIWRSGNVVVKSPVCLQCNVILISLDTLSADNLPCYGYNRKTAPNLCAYAKEHINFPHAYANSTYTLPTHTTMFTGLYPSSHGIQKVGDPKLAETKPFLPSILQNNGFRTIFLMDDENPHMPMDTVYYRGIDTQFDEDTDLWSRALREFEDVTRRGDKAFLFIHSYFVHPPYHESDIPVQYTHDYYDWMFMRDEDREGETDNFIKYLIIALENTITNKGAGDLTQDTLLLRDLVTTGGNIYAQRMVLHRYDSLVRLYRDRYDPLVRLNPNDSRQMSYLKAIYDERIQALDIGPMKDLLAFIQKPSIADHTIVIITSDHGEEFGEHGYVSHATLYNPNTHVVFIMSVPGLSRRIVPEYIQTADITPTLLGLLGISTQNSFDGWNITSTLYKQPLPSRVLVAESEHKTTIRRGKWKLFLDTRGKSPVPIELYDTEKDPGERKNILFDRFSLVHEMLNAYLQTRGFVSQSR